MLVGRQQSPDLCHTAPCLGRHLSQVASYPARWFCLALHKQPREAATTHISSLGWQAAIFPFPSWAGTGNVNFQIELTHFNSTAFAELRLDREPSSADLWVWHSHAAVPSLLWDSGFLRFKALSYVVLFPRSRSDRTDTLRITGTWHLRWGGHFAASCPQTSTSKSGSKYRWDSQECMSNYKLSHVHNFPS